MSEPVADIKLIRFDWAIKTILRDKANFDVLEGFLSALLGEDIIIEQLLSPLQKPLYGNGAGIGDVTQYG